MQLAKKSIFVFLLFLIAVSINAQNRTFSPYSRFGLGDIEGTSSSRGQGMGGTGIALRSSYALNDLNPAAATSIDSFSFVLEGGIGYFNQKIETATASTSKANMNFDFFAFGFPLAKKVFTTIGVKPYSGVGYNIEETIGEYPDRKTFATSGKGTISNAFFNLGVKPFESFSLGVSAGYLFGTQRHYVFTEFSDDPTALKFGSSREVRINNLLLNFGAQYTKKLSDSKRITLGATFTPQSNVNGNATILVESGYNYSSTDEIFSDGTVEQDTVIELKEIGSKLPMQIGLGVAYEVKNKLTTTLDYTYGEWSKTPFYETITQTANSQYANWGIEYIPDNEKADKFWARVRYRGGLYFKKDYLKFDSYQMEDYGMTFGIGIPLKKSKNSINFNLRYGTRGTTEFGLIKENYFRFSINLVMHEYWFVKRKID